MRLVLLGAPGVGKGTQAKLISEKLGIPQVSTGDMLRRAETAGTEVGLRAKKYMDAGDLVPDEVIIGVVEERLREPDCQLGYILDGFPRTLAQAQALDHLLRRLDTPLHTVLAFEVGEEEIIRRLGGRRVCVSCQATFHDTNQPPKQPGVCDKCQGALVIRDDDTPNAILHRLKVYGELTEPLLAFYAERGLLHRVDASRPVDEVMQTVTEVLDR